MIVYVRRNGRLVDKATIPRDAVPLSFPTPRISRMEPFESPVTGKTITSWGERDREMREHDCYDPRDMPPGHVYRRGREVQLKEVKANEPERPDSTGPDAE